MLTSLALVFLLGLAAAALCSRIGLPRIIGMLLTGILIGVCAELAGRFHFVYLVRAAADGAYHHLDQGRSVARPVCLKSRPTSCHDGCVPASCEILAFFLLAPHILGINRIEAAVMGAVLGAVSPAVVVREWYS